MRRPQGQPLATVHKVLRTQGDVSEWDVVLSSQTPFIKVVLYRGCDGQEIERATVRAEQILFKILSSPENLRAKRLERTLKLVDVFQYELEDAYDMAVEGGSS